MEQRAAFSSADGDMLLVPQQGTLLLRTEMGRLEVPPRHIAVVPRGIKFNVALAGTEPARGYVLEVGVHTTTEVNVYGIDSLICGYYRTSM
jgi:homogentisate 1,2-dioxygenase